MEVVPERRRESRRSRYNILVDSDNKATEFRLKSWKSPHMQAFHLSWLSFCSCFVSTFAMPPLVPVIREDLSLTDTQIRNAGIAAVAGAIFARLIIGTTCGCFGPRLTSAAIILLTSPAVYFTASISSPTSFILVRFFTGFSLSTFVSTQYWMSTMFSPPVVGVANGFAAGWGNLGGGATQLLMPLVHSCIQHLGATSATAWRIAFFIPGLLQTLTAFAIMIYGQDLPEGDFTPLQESGEIPRDNPFKVFYCGIKNYKGWMLAIAYGSCFGVELTIDNVIAEYFYDRFNLNLQRAGAIAAASGFANLISRPAGGLISDKMSQKFGMRGRLWSLWAVQTTGGLLCVSLGRVATLEASIAVMVVFSVLIQAACGLTFGIVPFVSRRSLGVVLGMVGAGGNVGAVITQFIFSGGSKHSKELGITLMGIASMVCTLPIWGIHFSPWGGMCSGPSANARTEEEHYMSEWNSGEIGRGLHQGSLRFAENSRSERGRAVRP